MSDDAPAWTESPTLLFRYRVMLQMARGETNCVEIAANLQDGPANVQAVFVDLVASGLAGHSPFRAGDTAPEDAHLTPAGKREVRRWEEGRTPGPMKRACMSAVLSWLDANEGRQIAGTDTFPQDVRGRYFGVPFSPETVGQAVHELVALDLVAGIKTNGPVLVRPRITSMGHAVHTQHGGDVATWMASTTRGGGDSFHISHSSGVAVANRSPSAQQSVHITNNPREQLLTVAAALEEMMDGLGLQPVDLAKAYGLVRQLKDAAEVVESEPERARGLLDGVKGVVISGTGSAMGAALVALVELVAQSF